MSPSLRPVWMFSSPATAARARVSSACVESVAHTPGVHSIFKRLAPLHRRPGVVRDDGDARCQIAHEVSVGLGPASGTMARTPRTFFAAESSRVRSVPSKYGERAMTAYSMPGICASMP